MILIGVMLLAIRGTGQERNRDGPKGPHASPQTHPVWVLEAKKPLSRTDAVEAVLVAAQQQVGDYLRSQDPPVDWTPPLRYVQERLIKKPWEEWTEKFVDPGDPRPEEHDFYHVRVEVEVTPEDRADMLRLARQELVQHRLAQLGKVFLALVVLLATVAGYLRLEEKTKGFYTGWLRLAALAVLLLAIGIGLYLIA
jgi:hypothetical protein